ncbi:class I SAM-dependent methyltransferase [Erythrobacter sp. HL-111]|uniref:class I SAM-dependent methyltransferase n=1 Tax=Erythrobacter sp. HL-111 TaxID=1798193 RepID=UPI0006DAF4D5|nr:class I SAM-dependent methyltransferase [Erythrobacter sp. HL-111]KPP83389.1 MAG: putative methyltransferase [Erythrobacteraceae bacterium HL-111]SDS97882.1 Predicted methyltransferase [Erythrobacter sp. HL-111]
MNRLAFASLAVLAAAGATLATAPAVADTHMEASAPELERVLADSRRDGDRARDQYRNPAGTLAFFGVEPDMTIAEFAPGGGWYTRVLAPYVMEQGRYVAFNTPARQPAEGEGWADTFAARTAQMLGAPEGKINAFEVGEMPEDMAGTVDRVLIFRSMHGLNAADMADSVLKTARRMLKDDGMVGVVQHRAPDGASYDDYGARQRGYMREADVVNIFEAAGFELVEKSEINANPKDPADWEHGVWTLPPTLATGEGDPKRSEYLEIGESDRMTLLFKKAY